MLGKQLADRRPKSTSLRHIEGDDVNAIREGGGERKIRKARRVESAIIVEKKII